MLDMAFQWSRSVSLVVAVAMGLAHGNVAPTAFRRYTIIMYILIIYIA